MDFKEFIQDKANKLVALDWPDDMILAFIDGAERTNNYFGWHPASELPPVETDIVVWCILDDGQIHVGMASLSEKKWPDALEKYVRWWCYPPKEEE